jgi:tyrosine-protein kinase Etk/Wzc
VDYLGGTATPAQIIRQTTTDHLSIVPSGSRSRRAPELLTSDRMASLVAEMRTQFEVVIIDSAPFVAGMDAFALGAAAGTMLVVLRPGITDRKLAENKLEILDRLPVTIIGAVLNAISSGRAYRYYSDYATYEGEEDQDEIDFDGGPPSSPTRLIGRR